jgi:hypothetical protein
MQQLKIQKQEYKLIFYNLSYVGLHKKDVIIK